MFEGRRNRRVIAIILHSCCDTVNRSSLLLDIHVKTLIIQKTKRTTLRKSNPSLDLPFSVFSIRMTFHLYTTRLARPSFIPGKCMYTLQRFGKECYCVFCSALIFIADKFGKIYFSPSLRTNLSISVL